MSARRRVSLLEGFRLLADPKRPMRDHRFPGHGDPLAELNFDMQALHDLAVTVVAPEQEATRMPTEPRWRSLMWGQHEGTTAREDDFTHRMRVVTYNQAPEVVARLDKVAPEPILIDLSSLDIPERSRFIDFLSGLSYGRHGEIMRVSDALVGLLLEPSAHDPAPAASTEQLKLIDDDDRIDAG